MLHQIAFLHAAAAIAACSSSPLSRAAAAADASGQTAAAARVAEHQYRMLARVRPLLFWITKDDVGGARVSWRGDNDGALRSRPADRIGSGAARPRQINRWGYIAEQVRGTDARVIGVMKQSNEQSIAEAESHARQGRAQGRLPLQRHRGQRLATAKPAPAVTTRPRAERDLTYPRHRAAALAWSTAAADTVAESRAVALPRRHSPRVLSSR